MTNVADAVREVPHRRKMLLFIGSSVAVSTTAIGCFGEVREAREKLLRAAGAANLTIHTFDSTLLQSGGSSASQSGGIPPATDASARWPPSFARTTWPSSLAKPGAAPSNTNAPWEPIPAIFDETESYYVLGFAPASQKDDGAFHNISVEVNLPGVQVHPRKGYYSPAPPPTASSPLPNAAPATLSAALRNMWPATQIPMGVTTAAFATPGASGATVLVVARAGIRRAKSTDPGQRV